MTVLGGTATDLSGAARPGLKGVQPGHVIAAAVAIAPTLAALAPLGVAPLFAIAATAVIGLHLFRQRTLPLPGAALLTIGLLLILWCSLGLLWAASPADTRHALPTFIVDVVATIGLIGAMAAAGPDERRPIGRALLTGFIVGAAVLTIELASGGAVVNTIRALLGLSKIAEAGELNRGAAFFALFAFPAAIAARRLHGWPAALAILAAALALTAAAAGDKAAIAVALGLIAVGGTLMLRRRAPPFLAALLIAVMAGAPLISATLDATPGPWSASTRPSVTHRVLIWRFVSERIAERPVLGWGLNSSRAIPGGKDGPMPGTELLPLHPHNSYLQIWLELGAGGAALVGGLLVLAVMSCRRLFADRLELGLALGAITAALTCAAVGYGLFQAWWLNSFILLAAVLAALRRPDAQETPPPR